MELYSIYQCFPREVWMEILSYLPVKLLLRFRSISKEWKSIIDNPDFASFHLERYPNNCCESHLLALEMNTNSSYLWAQFLSCFTHPSTENEFSVFVPYPDSNNCSPCSDNESYRQILEFDPPDSFNYKHVSGLPRIAGECDGLLLVQKELRSWNLGDVILWNPSIRKSFNIPPPPSLSDRVDLCLGFDPSTKDYKVVNILEYHNAAITCEVFSLNTRCWRSGTSPPPNSDDDKKRRCLLSGSGSKKVSLGGFVYWVARCPDKKDKAAAFVSFDMSSETLSTSIPLPVPHERRRKRRREMEEAPVVLAGSRIGLLTTSCIWALQSDGRGWSKIHNLDLDFCIPQSAHLYFHLKKDGVLVWGQIFFFSEGVICAYDQNTKVQTVLKDSSVIWPLYVGTFVESLVFLR